MPQFEHRLLFNARQHNILIGKKTIAHSTPKQVKSSCKTPILRDKRLIWRKNETQRNLNHHLPTRWTSTDYQYLSWNVYNRTLGSAIQRRSCSDRLSSYERLLMWIWIDRCSSCMMCYTTLLTKKKVFCYNKVDDRLIRKQFSEGYREDRNLLWKKIFHLNTNWSILSLLSAMINTRIQSSYRLCEAG